MFSKNPHQILDYSKELVNIFSAKDRKLFVSKAILRAEFERRIQPFAEMLTLDTIEAAALLVVLIDRNVCSAMPRQVSEFFGNEPSESIKFELDIIKSAKIGPLSKYLDVDDQTLRTRSYTFKENNLNEIHSALSCN